RALAFANESATAGWAPTGIALAALLVLGFEAWPGVALGAFLVNITTSGSPGVSAGIALGNTLEAVLGAWLVNRYAGGRRAFERSRDVFRMAALAGIGSTAVSATIGVSSLRLGGPGTPRAFGTIWLTWWLGDAVGAIVFTPLVILWCTDPRWKPPQGRTRESLIVLTCIVVLGTIVFCAPIPKSPVTEALGVLCFPLLV